MSDDARAETAERRQAMGWLARFGMTAGLAAAYGTLAAFMGRFLYPARPQPRGWLYVSEARRLKEGASLRYRTPSGATVNVARQRPGDDPDAFVALSSTCPHLGCQVHWEPHNNRFFCPCHNGVFTPDGTAIAGPPAEAGQSLLRYPLKIERGLLFIEVPLSEVAQGPGRLIELDGPQGPGHDPCLCAARPVREA